MDLGCRRKWLTAWFASTVLLCMASGLFAGLVRANDGQLHSQRETDTKVQDPGMGDWITRFAEDRKSIRFKYREPLSPLRRERLTQLYRAYLSDLERIEYDQLALDAKIDYSLMLNELQYQLELAQLETQRDWEAMKWLPAIDQLVALLERHERTHQLPPRETAAACVEIRQQFTEGLKLLPEDPSPEMRISAVRAVEALSGIERRVKDLYRFYEGYDPQFTWWCKDPVKQLVERLSEGAELIRQRGGIAGDAGKIVGQPIGAKGMAIELKHEMIPYSPEELIEIAEREFAWCDEQMLAASRELGFGDDWHAAMEHVKELHVEPGQQPTMIRNLAEEAIAFLKARDLITIPPLCEEAWRMEMMSPERQRVNPFFLGGDTIIVSYPTDSMTHEEKLMSMRGNNEHFSRATVQHELIPGHHLQMFMMDRYRPYRKVFETPFWIEGWALYWEMLLWDKEFPRSAEDRVGMLFWRKHRCARIIFSLGYQLGRMTPEECVEYLIERVGHEPANAEAEVRRSVMGGYSPLYQAAYMLGGLQIRALREQLVDSGQMSEREFHDGILREGPMPIEMVRAVLTGNAPRPDHLGSWRFAD